MAIIETMEIHLDDVEGLAGRLGRIREMAKEIESLPGHHLHRGRLGKSGKPLIRNTLWRADGSS